MGRCNKGVRMTARNTRRSPSPSLFGSSLSRRGLLQGAAGAAALGLGLSAQRSQRPGRAGHGLRRAHGRLELLERPAQGGAARRRRGVPEQERHHQAQRGRPQHLPGEHHHLPAEPGRRDPLVRRLPDAVLRRPGPARPHRRRLGGGPERHHVRGLQARLDRARRPALLRAVDLLLLGHSLPPEPLRRERVDATDDL